MSMYIGEALAGEGNEIAHIDLLIGSKDGPVGNAFANALARQSEGHSNLLAVLTPNLAVKPATGSRMQWRRHQDLHPRLPVSLPFPSTLASSSCCRPLER